MSLGLGLIAFYVFACPALGIMLSMNLGTTWRLIEAVLFLRVESNLSSGEGSENKKKGKKETVISSPRWGF